MISQLLKILRESIKAVPAMKYALAVAGLLAVVALVGAFKVSPAMAGFGAVATLVLMVAMVVFARLTTTAPRHFLLPVKVMMWAFLGLTIATASLLFTSAFFQWPRGLGEIGQVKPRGQPLAPPAAVKKFSEPPEASELRRHIANARELQGAGDFAGAWDSIGRAVALNPQSNEARDAQVHIAMNWIREISIREGETFSAKLRPLTECLRASIDRAKGNVPADIYAHLGWADFVRQVKEGMTSLKPEDSFTSAIARDAANPFAHAMSGYILAYRHRPLHKITPNFALALRANRERAYVQQMHVQALLVARSDEAIMELVRIADEMRSKSEPLSLEWRKRILFEAYFGSRLNEEAKLLKLLPPAQHLLTFEWLLTDLDLEQNPDYAYFQARLTEATGDDATAVELYRKLLEKDISSADRAKAALARCEQRLKRRN